MSVTLFFDEGTADEVEFTGEAFNISIVRGRSLEADVFGPGGGTIRVRNYEANFNPIFLTDTSAILMESDDFLLQENGDKLLLEFGNGAGVGTYGDIELGRKVTIKDGAATLFTGYVEDFDYDYSPDNRSEATITVRDGLGALGATTLREWLPTEGQVTGARISSLLDRPEVGFPTGAANRDIDTGTQPLSGAWNFTNAAGEQEVRGTPVSTGTNALQEIQRLNTTESGRCFVAADGKLTFQDRYAAFGAASSATFSDDGLDLPFREIGVRFGTELLHFQVTVTRDAGTDEQVARNEALIAGYPNLGVRNLPVGSLPLQSDDHAYGLAAFLLDRFQSFSAVVSDLSVALGRLSISDRATVCGLDIGDVVTVRWTPYGTSGAVSQTLAIDGVTYQARESKNGQGVTADAVMTFQLSDARDPGYFVLDTDALDGPAALAP